MLIETTQFTTKDISSDVSIVGTSSLDESNGGNRVDENGYIKFN